MFSQGDIVGVLAWAKQLQVQNMATLKDITSQRVGRKPSIFVDASIIAVELLNFGYEFEEGSVVFNQVGFVISYKIEEKPIFSLSTIASAGNMSIYDDIDTDVLQNYQECSLANIIYYSLKEYTISEQSTRMIAMGNASKNASEMIDKLTLTFNHTRQAVSIKGLIKSSPLLQFWINENQVSSSDKR
uniref:ATP synthase F1 subunit gamma n=1 Tax=Molossus molossus TaxID=27622 RepID=A0A7J8J7D8_MOLMO|nr:hypothetical protein HJG59_009568 [Molossus molossus]